MLVSLTARIGILEQPACIRPSPAIAAGSSIGI